MDSAASAPKLPDLTHPDTYEGGIPYEVFRWLRRHDPVSKQPQGYWAVTRYADIQTVLETPEVFSSSRGGVLVNDPPPQFLEKLRQNMLNSDPPRHTAMRRLVQPAFTPKRIAVLESKIAAHAHKLVDDVVKAHRNGTCDFAEEIAGKMPLFVICEILGVPPERRQELYTLTARMFGSHIKDPAAAFRDGMAAAEELRKHGAQLRVEKLAAPADDLASDLLQLDEGEFLAMFMLLFNAGADTTRTLLCHGLDLLLHRPMTLARLRHHPSLLPAAIDEMLRFEPSVILFRRTTTQAFTLGDGETATTIPEGAKVVVFFPSANRDETVFPDPNHFDIDRTPNNHLSFGHATHYCLGAQLAQLECLHVFREVLARFHHIERDGALVRTRSSFIRSVKHQPIRFRTH